MVTFEPVPTANAGPDQTVCADVPTVTMLGYSVGGGATAGAWSGGAGTWVGDVYTPTAGEIATGSVELAYCTTDAAPCADVCDYMTVTFKVLPTAYAGLDQLVCADVTTVTMAGYNVGGGATAGAWSGGAGTWAGDVYTPTAGEIAAGSIVLTYCTTDAAPCADVCDNMTININKNPVVDAGVDATICIYTTFTTNATVSNASAILWYSPSTQLPNGGVFVPDNELVSVYTPSAAEYAAGSVELYLVADPISPCTLQALDSLLLTFDPLPTAYAGDDATICEGQTYTLAGVATNHSSVLWSGGTGTFNDATLPNATYTPGAADITAGFVSLSLKAFGAGACNLGFATDTTKLTIVQKPVITLAAERELNCDDLIEVDFRMKWDSVRLESTVVNEASVQWSTSGDGYFVNPNIEDAVYMIGVNDAWNYNGITLTLTAFGPGNCGTVSVSSSILLKIPTQIIPIESLDWRGISSYVDKSAVSVPTVMAPVFDPLVIMINRDGEYYWPDGNGQPNQLEDWLPIGYKAKFNSTGCLPIYGDTVTDQTFTTGGRFSFMPVLTNVVTPIADLIGADTTKIELIYDWVLKKVWRSASINDIDFLYFYPGNAYLLVAKAPYEQFTVTYPDFISDYTVLPKANEPVDFGPNTTPWNDVVSTSDVHFIMFEDAATSHLQSGDVIAAFDQNGNCVGMETFNSADRFYKLVANGDDVLTSEVDGYEVGEAMNFKLYRQSTEEIFDVAFTYDPNSPNYDGNFAIYGVSTVVGMTMNITSINDVTNNNVQVYPNPAREVINIVSDLNVKNITMINYVGQTVYNQNVSGNNFQINVSDFGTGMYMVRIETIEGTIITKRIAVK